MGIFGKDEDLEMKQNIRHLQSMLSVKELSNAINATGYEETKHFTDKAHDFMFCEMICSDCINESTEKTPCPLLEYINEHCKH